MSVRNQEQRQQQQQIFISFLSSLCFLYSILKWKEGENNNNKTTPPDWSLVFVLLLCVSFLFFVAVRVNIYRSRL